MDEIKKKKILSIIDHTLLNPNAEEDMLFRLAEESLEYHTASVCVMPCAVKKLREKYQDTLTICTVIGFPLGYQTTEAKKAEAADALANGADELDMVMNRVDLKNGGDEEVTKEIREIKEICGEKILKVIVESCDLSEEEKIRACRCVSAGGADFIKTSTGFGKGGAVLADVELFRNHIDKNVKIKAAGGIRRVVDLEAFFDAGCDRIGASCGVEVLK